MPRFSLQTALDVRERMEKLKQKEFAQQLQVAQELKARIGDAQDAIVASNGQMNQLKSGGFSVAHLQFHESYKSRMNQQIAILEQQLKEQNEVVDVKQQELVEATQKRRVLEILKEKELFRHRKKQERLERLEMDEISQNFAIKQRSH